MKTKPKKTWLAKAAESLDETARKWRQSAAMAHDMILKRRWSRRAADASKMAAACREADEE